MKRGFVFLCSCLLVYLSTTVHGALYDGHKILRVYPRTVDDVTHIHGLTKRLKREASFWDDDQAFLDPSNPLSRKWFDLLTSPRAYRLFVEALRHRELPYDVITEDLQRELDDHFLQNAVARHLRNEYFDSYHPLEEIYDFMYDVADRCIGDCDVFTIGASYEGRPLKVIKISSPVPGNKRKMWIDGGIHAREWISHATAQYIMDRLVADYETDSLVAQMVDTFDWYIMPCINADGYNYTWETNRLWRKTRRPNPGTECIGTDANRNFDFKWGTVGASTDPCANNYQGPHAYSEVESEAVSDFILGFNGTWDLYLSLHSKGQLLMAPWGYTTDKPANFPEMEKLGMAMKKAINDTHGMFYEFGSASDILYASSGTSRDWAKGVPSIRYVYTIELRDTGEFGWELPPDQIKPTGEEIWAALKASMDIVING